VLDRKVLDWKVLDQKVSDCSPTLSGLARKVLDQKVLDRKVLDCSPTLSETISESVGLWGWESVGPESVGLQSNTFRPARKVLDYGPTLSGQAWKVLDSSPTLSKQVGKCWTPVQHFPRWSRKVLDCLIQGRGMLKILLR